MWVVLKMVAVTSSCSSEQSCRWVHSGLGELRTSGGSWESGWRLFRSVDSHFLCPSAPLMWPSHVQSLTARRQQVLPGEGRGCCEQSQSLERAFQDWLFGSLPARPVFPL